MSLLLLHAAEAHLAPRSGPVFGIRLKRSNPVLSLSELPDDAPIELIRRRAGESQELFEIARLHQAWAPIDAPSLRVSRTLERKTDGRWQVEGMPEAAR